MSNPWYFHYQQASKESKWQIALVTDKDRFLEEHLPAFHTVLDLSSVPADNDWSKTRYVGPFYADFDAEGDIEFVIVQTQLFIHKLFEEGVKPEHLRIFASGSKGFHIEIPMACFEAKPCPGGYQWLPYIYREVAKHFYVDSLDLNVYTGKRGRMWRTPGVQRENGKYKVPVTMQQMEEMTPELYAELISEPRPLPPRVPVSAPVSALSMLFTQVRDDVIRLAKTRTKRLEASNEALKPWKDAKRHPPMLLKIMSGEGVQEGAGFQQLSMQIAIYAASVEMSKDEMLTRCEGLIENHVSDSYRYNNKHKRRVELERMWDYMQSNTLYEFDVGPVVKLLNPSEVTNDFGPVETKEAPVTTDGEPIRDEAGNEVEPNLGPDPHATLRRGFFMTKDGMFRKGKDFVESICRASISNVEILEAPPDEAKNLGMENLTFYNFDLKTKFKTKRVMVSQDIFTSATKIKQLMAANQTAFQGTDNDVGSLLDVVTSGRDVSRSTFVYPREGLFILQNPLKREKDLVMCYLTQDYFRNSLQETDPHYFKLKYRPANAMSSYNVDIHLAPDLDEKHIPYLKELFRINAPRQLADMLGWFIAAHFRSVYLHLFGQFPMLHLWGEAGAGKSKTAELLARLHWYHKHKVQIKSAMSSTNFALDVDASTSTSCPMIIDEWKPKELRSIKGRYEKLKDILKAAYIGSDVGNRGVLNKGAESSMGVVKSKATAPIVFLAESIESETAIFERSVSVSLKQDLHKLVPQRQRAFKFLYESEEGCEAISALGKAIVDAALRVIIERFKGDYIRIRDEIESRLAPLEDDDQRKSAPRMIANRALIIHGLTIGKKVMQAKFGDLFDADWDMLLEARYNPVDPDEKAMMQVQGMSEISKVLSRMALLSRARDEEYELKKGTDYVTGDGWVELKGEAAYNQYRKYCHAIYESPLFNNMDQFLYAMSVYSPVIDMICADSELRVDGSSERIYRLDTMRMIREGVHVFR